MRRFILRAPCSPAGRGRTVGDILAPTNTAVARLGLAVDGTRLTVDLALPAESVFGFERAPRSAEERATAAEALDRLRAGGARLIAFPAGVTCTLDSAEVEAPAHPGEDQQPHEDDDQPHEDDDDQHEDEGHQPHEDHQHQDEGQQHEDVHLLASLTCSREPVGPASLRFADLLPGVVQVDLTVFTAAGEAAGRVAPDAAFRF